MPAPEDKLIIDPNHESMVADHFIYPQCKETTFMIPSLFTLRKQNDSYIHSEHLKMHDEVQVMMFKMWAKFNIAKVKKIAIVSNNDWGIEYYESKRIDFNSPTIGTSMTHADYIKFLERFDEYIDKTPEKVESEEKYPVGKISLDNESALISM
mgnify:CR=1 FL=1